MSIVGTLQPPYAVSDHAREAIYRAVADVAGVAMVTSASPLRRVLPSSSDSHPEWIGVEIDGGEANVDVSIGIRADHLALEVAHDAHRAVVWAWRALGEIDHSLPHLGHVGIHVVSATSRPDAT